MGRCTPKKNTRIEQMVRQGEGVTEVVNALHIEQEMVSYVRGRRRAAMPLIVLRPLAASCAPNYTAVLEARRTLQATGRHKLCFWQSATTCSRAFRHGPCPYK